MAKPKLNESYCSNISVTYSAKTMVSCSSIIFALNSFKDAEFFIKFGRTFRGLGVREERLSEP